MASGRAPGTGRSYADLHKDWTPPVLPVETPPEVTHPVTTRHVSSHIERREVLLPGIDDGPRYILYGHQCVAGKLQFAHYEAATDRLWVAIELCAGECNALLDVKYADGRAAPAAGPAGVWEYWWYPGTAVGAIDSHLAAVRPSWNEPFAGTCNVIAVFRSFGKFWNAQVPDFLYRMETRKCLSPSTGLYTYSTSVWDQWFDFVRWSEGKQLPAARVDAASFVAAKAADIAAGRKHESHLALLDWQSPDDVVDVFRLMARSYWFWDANKFKVCPDRPGASVETLTDDAVPVRTQLDLDRVYDLFDRVNQVTIWYTDTVNGWQQKPYTYPETPPVGEDIVEEEHRLPHLHDPALVKSIAVWLYYKRVYDMRLKEPWMAWTNRDLGDIVERDVESRGLTIPFRYVRRTKDPDKNITMVELHEINDDMFDEFSNVDSPKFQSDLPDPGAAPPDVVLGSITATEELFQSQPGQWLPRLAITFTMPVGAFVDAVVVFLAVNGGTQRKWFETVSSPVFTPALFEPGTYALTFKTRNRITQELSAGVTKNVTVLGKTAVPADPLGLTGGANNGQVYLWWQPSLDLDVKSYEIRRGVPGDTWATATYDGQTNVTSWSDEPPYAGTVRYFLKAIDVAGRYSANAATFDIVMQAVGNTATESWFELWPDSPEFTRVAPGDFISGLWYGTGNLIMEMMPARDAPAGHHTQVMLTRTFSPAAAEAERAAGAYASVGAWAAAVDDPRRGGAPLWAPLPANAQGEIWHNGSSAGSTPSRLREMRARPLSVVHSGLDVPTNVAVAQPLYMDDYSAPSVKHYGHSFQASPLDVTRGLGLRLSSNSPYYQQIVTTAIVSLLGTPNRLMMHAAQELKPVTFASGLATTDGSGVVTVSYSYVLSSSVSAWLSIDATPAGAAAVVVVVDAVDTVAKTVRFKSYDAAGSVLPAVKFGYKLIDNGGSTAFGVWL